jgi:hypothetical protein
VRSVILILSLTTIGNTLLNPTRLYWLQSLASSGNAFAITTASSGTKLSARRASVESFAVRQPGKQEGEALSRPTNIVILPSPVVVPQRYRNRIHVLYYYCLLRRDTPYAGTLNPAT